MHAELKIVMLGDGRVGKTSLVLRYTTDQFEPHQASTVNASCLEKWLKSEEIPIKLVLWDTASQERFRALASIYYRKAHGACLVYDITDTSSFERIQHWMVELQTQASEHIQVIVIGNKSDQTAKRQVPRSEAEEYARLVGASFTETSAKTGVGVTEAFAQLVAQILANPASHHETVYAARGQPLSKLDQTNSSCCSCLVFICTRKTIYKFSQIVNMKQSYSHTLVRTKGVYDLNPSDKFSFMMSQQFSDYERLQQLQCKVDKTAQRKLKQKHRTLNKLLKPPRPGMSLLFPPKKPATIRDPVLPKVSSLQELKRPFGSKLENSHEVELPPLDKKFTVRRFRMDPSEFKLQKTLLGKNGIIGLIAKTDSAAHGEEFQTEPQRRILNLNCSFKQVESEQSPESSLRKHRLKYNFSELTKGTAGEYYTKKFIPKKVQKLFDSLI